MTLAMGLYGPNSHVKEMRQQRTTTNGAAFACMVPLETRFMG